MANKHLQHVKSNVVNEDAQGNKSPKLPNVDSILPGELAVNYADGYERISLKNTNNEIVQFVSKEYVDQAAEDANEVQIGGNTPQEGAIEIFIDTTEDPLTYDVYTKAEVNEQVQSLQNEDTAINQKVDDMIIIGSSSSSTTNTEIVIDTQETVPYETYTKAQVDVIVANLQAQIDELKTKVD